MNTYQSAILQKLHEVLKEATKSGVLDDLTEFVHGADSTNDFCDGVEALLLYVRMGNS